MSRFGFVGPSYASQSGLADAQACVNWYVENMEDPGSKAARVLYPTPGLVKLATFPGGASRAEATLEQTTTDRFFSVNGAKFYEGFSDGSFNELGAVENDGLPAWIAVGPTFLSVCSGGHLYSYNLTTGAFTEIDTVTGAKLQGRVSQVGFSDGYFIALLSDSNKWQISALEDSTAWDPLDIAQISVYADKVIGMLVDHREVWFFGSKASVAYYNSGNPFFPFDVIPSSYNEYGCDAGASPAKLDNTVFLLTKNKEGGKMAFRIDGYRFVRISNHAVETAWSTYSKTSDAWTFAYQDQGHSFWVVNFPAADKTWVFDVATSLWHERGYFVDGGYQRILACTHAFAFGVHLVGDRRNGNIYKQTIAALDDDGQPIRRMRRAAAVGTLGVWMFGTKLEIDVETGLGPQPPLQNGDGTFRGPQMMLRHSDNGCKTFSNERFFDCGQAGQHDIKVRFWQLGRWWGTKGRVFEISCTDPVPWRIIDADLEASPGFTATERMTSQMRKGA